MQIVRLALYIYICLRLHYPHKCVDQLASAVVLLLFMFVVMLIIV